MRMVPMVLMSMMVGVAVVGFALTPKETASNKPGVDAPATQRGVRYVHADGSSVVTGRKGLRDALMFFEGEGGTPRAVYTGKDADDRSASVYDVAFSPDGRYVATATGKGSCVGMFETATGKLRWNGKAVDGGEHFATWGVGFSADGKWIAAATNDNDRHPAGARVLVLDAESGKVVKNLVAGEGSGNDAAFSHDGKLLASANGNGTMTLWETKSWAPVAIVQTDLDEAEALIFSPDDRTVALGGRKFRPNRRDQFDAMTVLIDVEKRKPARTIAHDAGIVRGVAFSPDGSMLAVIDSSRDEPRRHGMSLWRVASGENVAKWKSDARDVYSVAFRDDKTLITGHEDGVMKRWQWE